MTPLISTNTPIFMVNIRWKMVAKFTIIVLMFDLKLKAIANHPFPQVCNEYFNPFKKTVPPQNQEYLGTADNDDHK